MRAFLLAGTHSGVGKTTITLALIAALRARGLRVRAFKAGPDFIDAAHLTGATGVACLNLDGWMLGRALVQQRLAAAAGDCDIAIVEAMMGVYDGLEGSSEAGSSAELAKWLGLPVVLVADAAGGARSLAATVLGFQMFDRGMKLAGVIFNRVGGPAHTAYLRQGMQSVVGVMVLGGCPAEPKLHLPERHLGLTLQSSIHPEADWAEQHVDIGALLVLGVEVAPDKAAAPQRMVPSRRLGIARDEAFCFYYPDNLDLLRDEGIELVEFSPLHSGALPPGLDGIYLGGGYPELHASALHANRSLREEVRGFAAAGGFIYAECGGLMYLAEELDGVEMVGALPCRVAMQAQLAAIGYREVVPVGLGGEGSARGHEFHHSRLAGRTGQAAPAHWVLERDGTRRAEGFQCGNVTASYIHLHFASCPELPGLIKRRLASTARPQCGRAGLPEN